LNYLKKSYGHSSGKIEDRDTFISSLVSGKSDFVTLDLTDQKVAVSGNTAIVRHTLNADINDGGVAGHVRLYVLLVWGKEGSQWKLLARQAVKVPA
jgi:ketosteroid isomerase-like protein